MFIKVDFYWISFECFRQNKKEAFYEKSIALNDSNIGAPKYERAPIKNIIEFWWEILLLDPAKLEGAPTKLKWGPANLKEDLKKLKVGATKLKGGSNKYDESLHIVKLEEGLTKLQGGPKELKGAALF